MKRHAILLLLSMAGLSPLLADCSLHSDDHVLFYPTYGFKQNATSPWSIPVEGWVYQDKTMTLRDRAVLATVGKALGLYEKETATPLFAERASYFWYRDQPKREIKITLMNTLRDAGLTDRNGEFSRAWEVSESTITHAGDDTLSGETVLPVAVDGCDRLARGVVRLIPVDGLSVISDIDDTLKTTHVEDRRALLANTFLRPFSEIEGMSALYQGWAKHGAVFHYVSESPYQLLPALSAFLNAQKFPEGVIHLKRFRLRNRSFLSLFDAKAKNKQALAQQLFERFPHRRFILVGDTLQQDPEIYGDLCRRYPMQVLAIFIREARPSGRDEARYQKAFRDVPSDRWQVFQAASEVKTVL